MFARRARRALGGDGARGLPRGLAPGAVLVEADCIASGDAARDRIVRRFAMTLHTCAGGDERHVELARRAERRGRAHVVARARDGDGTGRKRDAALRMADVALAAAERAAREQRRVARRSPRAVTARARRGSITFCVARAALERSMRRRDRAGRAGRTRRQRDDRDRRDRRDHDGRDDAAEAAHVARLERARRRSLAIAHRSTA